MSLIKPTAIVIDDQILDNKVLATLLKRFGITPVTLFAESDVSTILSEMKFDICFVDLNLSEKLSGLNVIKNIREVFGKAIKVVAVSGSNDRETIEQTLMVGANDFISKPFDFNLVGAKLAQHFSTP